MATDLTIDPVEFAETLIDVLKTKNWDDISTVLSQMPEKWGFLYSENSDFWCMAHEWEIDGDIIQVSCPAYELEQILSLFRTKLFNVEKWCFDTMKVATYSGVIDMGTPRTLAKFKKDESWYNIILAF